MNKKLTIVTIVVVAVSILAGIAVIVLSRRGNAVDDIAESQKQIDMSLNKITDFENLNTDEITKDGTTTDTVMQSPVPSVTPTSSKEEVQKTTSSEVDNSLKEIDTLINQLDSSKDFADFGSFN